MTERKNNKNEIQVKSFNYKWYEFLFTYGIFNIFFFLGINNVVNNIYENFSKLHVSNLMVDGSDFSIFANLFATPILFFMVITSIGFFLIQELIIILIFKFVYFLSMVKNEEMIRLYQYIKMTLLCFILPNMLVIMFRGDIKRIIFFVFLYLPLPLFTFILIGLKMKRCIKQERLKKANRIN